MKDILAPDLKILFVGFNPSPRSGETGHHYAGPGNQFWRLLHESGLTPRRLRPDECTLLPEFGLGSTNLVSRPTRTAAELSKAELRAGAPRMRDLVGRYRPQVVAYTGKGVYLAAIGRAHAPWGLQPDTIAPPACDFVVPSPSGLVRMTLEEKLHWFRQLTELVKKE